MTRSSEQYVKRTAPIETHCGLWLDPEREDCFERFV